MPNDGKHRLVSVLSWVSLLAGAIAATWLLTPVRNPSDAAASLSQELTASGYNPSQALDSKVPNSQTLNAEPPHAATRSIEEIRVGDRVLARNPETSDTERVKWQEPDWRQWVRLSLVMLKPDGSQLSMELLRPKLWVLSQMRFVVDDRVSSTGDGVDDGDDRFAEQAKGPLQAVYEHVAARRKRLQSQGQRLLGLTFEMDLPELGLTGDAILVGIDPQPAIAAGSGSVVTATFHHSSGDVIDLAVADDVGTHEVIGTTGNHPFWSFDRSEYVPAGELASGERVLTYSGDTKRVESKLPRPGPQSVYNLEVYGEHVYFVGESGLLVHNSYLKHVHGLEDQHVYVLKNRSGRILYVGITEQDPRVRMQQHLNGSQNTPKKDFHHMEVIASFSGGNGTKARRQARNLEGSLLFHLNEEGNTSLLNKRVKDDTRYYHSYYEGISGNGRAILPRSQVDKFLREGLYSVLPPSQSG